MFKRIALSAAAALCLTGTAAMAAGGAGKVKDIDFSFEGPFGTVDENQLQRGLQVYTEICSSCHGLKFVPIRTLSDAGGPHLPEDQMRAYAEFYEVFDPALDDFRPAKPTDHFPESSLENAPDVCVDRPAEPDWMQSIALREAYKRVLVQDIYRAQNLERILEEGNCDCGMRFPSWDAAEAEFFERFANAERWEMLQASDDFNRRASAARPEAMAICEAAGNW